jgi:hypothetical protein
MTRNQNEYALQPMATAMRTVAKGDEALWADTVHAHWSGGHYAPSKGNHALLLRAMFRAIRLLERGTDRQKKQAGDLSRFLANVWGLQKAYVTAGEGDIDATRELRERWGDVQLPPIDGGFVGGIAADEAVIDAIVRRLK